ncbi:MAG: OmpL47-type beta-barrel domain-containing protein [Candidatus Kariarchaeaceae archaeon]|jgi:hypothetical protein
MFLTIILFNYDSRNFSKKASDIDIQLKTSTQDISIITPENKTYSESMSGYYPATYGFESDVVGGDANDWDDSASDSGCGSQVVAEKNGHYNVILIDDNSGTGKARLNNHFADQNYGTVELWITPEDASNGGVVRLMDMDLTENRAYLRLKDDVWYHYNGITDTVVPNVPNPQDNVWQHVRIDFESSTGGYLGLTQYTFNVTIDGINSGSLPFHTNGGSVDRFNIFTGDAQTVERWIDAVGYSWDPNYDIGDNLLEGLLLSYENTTNLEWKGYSLDGNVNMTILGNTTIILPDDGTHSIQVFGSNSQSANFQSKLKYFSVDTKAPVITINSPVPHEFFGISAPNFDISIDEPFLNFTWNTLDGGIINKTFSGFTGTIDQTEWDKIGNGSVTIRFYANDSTGNQGYEEVKILKDTITPTSLISFKNYGGFNMVNVSTTFTLTADDAKGSGIQLIRYKINDSSWNTYSSPFDLSNLEPGYYNITYQAIDNVGNIEIENSILVRLIEIPSPPSGGSIGSFNIFILLSLTGLLIVIVYRKKSKMNN